MNWLDIVLLCLAGIGFMKGLFDGMIKQVVSLIALVVAIFFCGKVAGLLAVYLAAGGYLLPEWVAIGSYVLAFVLLFGVAVLGGVLITRIIDVTPLGILNHLGGGLLGLVFMVLFCSLSLNLIELIDRKNTLISTEAKIESRFYFQIKEIVPTIYPHKLFINGQVYK